MVYLIHFDRPFQPSTGKKQHLCSHYIGYSNDEKFDARIECHKSNRGAKILKAVNDAGIGWQVVRTWPGEDGNFERKLKNQRNAQHLCPVCHEKYNKKKSKQQRERRRKKREAERLKKLREAS